MKRTANYISDNTRSKRIKLDILPEKELEIVSASHLYNYMMQDPLVDWLKINSQKNKIYSSSCANSYSFTDFIMNRGIEFESKLIKYIHTNKIPVITVSEYITDDSVQKVKNLMIEGVPLIHSAPVKNKIAGTQGVIDILIRSDYLNLLSEDPCLSTDESIISAPLLKKPYHYVVIDIKFSTLPLRADGIHLLNSGSYPAYKAQCLVYTEAVGVIQGFTAPYSFIIGRRWRFTNGKIVKQNQTCLNRLGKISYDSIDSDYKRRTYEAIQWIRDVKTIGHTWTSHPPSRIELYPNMSVDSGKWNIEKKKIAEESAEITSIWYIGVKERNIAVGKGINSWTDVRCTSKNMNITSTRSRNIDAILDINRQNEDKIRPLSIKSNLYEWRSECNEIYVDFETLSDIFADFSSLPYQSKSDMIFMIGVGWSDNKIWKYKHFVCNQPTYEEEYRIMEEFKIFLSDRGNPKMHCWHAEPIFWDVAEKRQFDLTKKKQNIEAKWADMRKLFISEPIVIKGCFKFGLKEISLAMRSSGMISSSLESTNKCSDGKLAMIQAWQIYTTKNTDVLKEMQNIIKYNELDCKLLWEIITYLRKYH